MSETLRIGVLGCARINQTALLDAAPAVPEVEIAAVASQSAERAEQYAAEHDIPQAYGSYPDLIADSDVDVVYNPLPNHLHAHWTIEALTAGKAVLCEKPLASNADEAARMVATAQQTGRPLIEAVHYRHHPMARYIGQCIQSGALGSIRFIDTGFNIPGRYLRPDDIRFQYEFAGGATMDLGTYCINILRLITAEEPVVTQASASMSHSPNVDAGMSATLAFPGGTQGSFACSLAHESLQAWLKVEGERGSLVADRQFFPQLGHSLTITRDGERETKTFDRTASYVYQLRSLADVILNGAESPTPGEDGLANMRVIDAVYRAAGLTERGI